MATLITDVKLITVDGNMVLQTTVTDGVGNKTIKQKVLCASADFEKNKTAIVAQFEATHKAQLDYAMQVMYIADQELKLITNA